MAMIGCLPSITVLPQPLHFGAGLVSLAKQDLDGWMIRRVEGFGVPRDDFGAGLGELSGEVLGPAELKPQAAEQKAVVARFGHGAL